MQLFKEPPSTPPPLFQAKLPTSCTIIKRAALGPAAKQSRIINQQTIICPTRIQGAACVSGIARHITIVQCAIFRAAHADFRPRHAALRQHSDRADTGQSSANPWRRRVVDFEVAAKSVLNGSERYPECVPALDGATLRRIGQAYLASLPALAVGKTRISISCPATSSTSA